MQTPQLILLERRGVWAAALRTHLPSGVRLAQTRSLAEFTAQLIAAPLSLAAVELSMTNLLAVLDWAERTAHACPYTRWVALALPEVAGFAPLVREAGAIDWIDSPRRIAPLARYFENHTRRLPATEASLTSRVWQSLPWSEAI